MARVAHDPYLENRPSSYFFRRRLHRKRIGISNLDEESVTDPRPYDAEADAQLHEALLHVVPVFQRFRTGFLGRVSPVHFFWGSFDLAVTRFSGRTAPLHSDVIPNMPDAVAQAAYSHEVSSAGFWPGGCGMDEPSFYAYAYPTLDGFAEYPVQPAAARFDTDLGE